MLSEVEYQEYVWLKSNIQTQSSSTPSVSVASISQYVDSPGPWVIDLGFFDHISRNSSLFTSLSSQKFPHPITLANGSKVASKSVDQISPSPSLSLEFVLFVLN